MNPRRARGISGQRSPAAFIARVAVAEFDGTAYDVAVTWAEVRGEFYLSHGVRISDAYGPISVTLYDVTATGCTVTASDLFTGRVDIVVHLP